MPPPPPKTPDVPDKFTCSITRQIMSDPVVTTDGQVYEREAIEGWLAVKGTSPNTNLALESKNLIPLHVMRDMITDFLSKHPKLVEQGRVYVPKIQKKRLHKKLFSAIKSDNDKAVRQLLQEGADIEAFDEEGRIPLFIGIETGAYKVVQLLLKSDEVKRQLTRSISVGKRDSKTRMAPIHSAVKIGNVEMAKLLIETKADLRAQDEDMCTPLILAAKQNSIKMAEVLIVGGADVLQVGDLNHTPLHTASIEGSIGVAKLLLDNKANTELLTNFAETPLHLATAFDFPDVAKLLLDNKANIQATNHIGNPLHYAISEKHENLTRLMLKWKASIDAVDRDGDAPLALAAMKGFNLAVTLLIEKGADVLAKSNERRTALHHAASQGHLDLVTILLDSGAVINAQTIYGQTPLNRACVKGRLGVAKLLIERKADFELCDRWGATPLFRAARNNRKEVVQYLISVGANMDTGITEGHAGDQELNTALHTAAWRCHHDIVEVLLENFADYTATNADGDTPASLALSKDEGIADQITRFEEKEQKRCPLMIRRMNKSIQTQKVENRELRSEIDDLKLRLKDMESVVLADKGSKTTKESRKRKVSSRSQPSSNKQARKEDSRPQSSRKSARLKSSNE